MNRAPVKKSLSEIALEDAHGGAGKRQLIFNKSEPFVSSQFEAMTKGFLPPGAAYDWHQHDGIDEFFLVVNGTGKVEYADSAAHDFVSGDVLYMPAGISHKITNTGKDDNVFFFVRIKA